MSFLEKTVYDPQFQKFARVDQMRGMNVEERIRLIGTAFGSAIDTQFWTAANNGTGSAAGVANGIATLTSGTANNGYGSITTNRLARFLFANMCMYRGAVRMTATTVANCTRRWGALNITAGSPPTYTNGFYFELSGAGALSVVYNNNGTPTSVASGSFNGEVSTYTMDTNVHAYEIMYFVMGAWFFIDGVLIHKFSPTTGMFMPSLDLKAAAIVVNSASGTASGTLELWAATIMRLGRETTRPKGINLAANTTTTLKLGPGALHRVTVNIPGSNNNTVTIYDNTAGSGTILASFSNASVGTYEMGFDFMIGLTVVSATGTAANLTVVYD